MNFPFPFLQKEKKEFSLSCFEYCYYHNRTQNLPTSCKQAVEQTGPSRLMMRANCDKNCEFYCDTSIILFTLSSFTDQWARRQDKVLEFKILPTIACRNKYTLRILENRTYF